MKRPENYMAVDTEDSFIKGRSVRVVYRPGSQTITLYRLEGCRAVQASKPSRMGYPVVDGKEVSDFTDFSCAIDRSISGTLGTGERMTITSYSPSLGVKRTYILETSDTVKGAVYTQTFYQAEDQAVRTDRFADSLFELYDPGQIIWSFNGGGEGPTTFYDQLQKIDLSSHRKFYRENRQDYTAAALPIADVYNAQGGITIGDASSTRREVHTPVEETEDSVQISIEWPGKTIVCDEPLAAGQSFVIVHQGDYFVGLRGYKYAMERLGIVMKTNISQRSYQQRWEGWGWAFDWTAELIIHELDFLQKAGVKQITIDDAWYDHAGDWQLNPEKFPNGEEDMIRLVNAIHDHGMTALLWWRPCDGGRDDSKLYKEHPEYFIMNKDGSTAKIGGPGKTCTCHWCQTAGYALCPGSEGAIQITKDFINRAMKRWGFDGFKGDFVWSLGKCYNPAHNHKYPEESTERQTEFYKAAHDTMMANDLESFNLLCNCGAPQDFYGLQYMTQVVTADPVSLDQTRTRVKAYKALMGDYYPITTDHCQIWYSTTVGTGSVIIEKTAFTGAEAEEYVRWLKIADREGLHKGRFVGGLYSYGFDPYETYVVEKDGVMHYAFYRDGKRCQPNGYPEIELKGLVPDKMYRIVDYVNGRVVATNLMGDHAVFHTRFAKDLLVKAVEISEPDTEPVETDWGFACLAADSHSLVYTGAWQNEETGKAASENGASVECRFAGTSVRWYGNKTAAPGTAEVYLDGTLVSEVSTGGSVDRDVRLFEALDLLPTVHTLKITCRCGTAHITRIAIEEVTPEPAFEMVDPLSERIVYHGKWELEVNAAMPMGKAKCSGESGASFEMKFNGSAIRWYGKRIISPYAVAMVYLDGEQAETVYTYGEDEFGKLLFEKRGLEPGEHTIKIVQSMHTIEVECMAVGNDVKL